MSVCLGRNTVSYFAEKHILRGTDAQLLLRNRCDLGDNLAPRPMLKGKYVSEGMIFAADTADGGCSIAFYGDDTPVGSRIH